MLSAVVWHGLAAFGRTGIWQDITTALEALAVAGAFLLLQRSG